MTRLCITTYLALSVAAATAVAQDFGDSQPPGDATFVKPFVGETTFLILKVDPKRIAVPDGSKALGSAAPEVKAAYEEAAKSLAAGLVQLRSLADEQPVFATVGIPTSTSRFALFGFRKKTSDKNAAAVTAFIKDELKGKMHAHENYLIATPREGEATVSSPASAATQDRVAAAFKAVAEEPVQVLLVPPEHVWRTVRELSPRLPRQLGGGPSQVLTDGVQWVAIGLDPEKLRVQVVIQSASEDAARAFAEHVTAMLTALDESKSLDSRIPAKLSKPLIASLKPQVEGSQVRVHIDGLEKHSATLDLVARVVQAIEENLRRDSNVQRFRNIMLAMHNYHDTHKAFPPADKHRNKEGKHGLSWRVHILPYVEQQALYDQFRLNEPWDSPHNIKLIEKMPDIYASDSAISLLEKMRPGYTTFLAPVGERTISGGAKATKFPDITDGTSNTVAVLEVKPEKAVPWTAPQDYAFDPKDPLSGVLIGKGGTWLCGAADGSVHQVRGDVSKKTALFLFQMSDGNPVDFN